MHNKIPEYSLLMSISVEEDGDTLTKEKTETKEQTDTPKVVIVHNDDYNTFDHVASCLIRICKHDHDTAWQKTIEIHQKGKSVVYDGSDDDLKLVKCKLQSEGLCVTIESAT